MNLPTYEQAKLLVMLSRSISLSAKSVHSDLATVLDATDQLKDVSSDITELSIAAMDELTRARGLLSECLAITDTLYRAGLDSLLEEGEQ